MDYLDLILTVSFVLSYDGQNILSFLFRFNVKQQIFKKLSQTKALVQKILLDYAA